MCLAAAVKAVREAAPDTARNDRREIELSDDTIGLYHAARQQLTGFTGVLRCATDRAAAEVGWKPVFMRFAKPVYVTFT